jgi:hypothetical protein
MECCHIDFLTIWRDGKSTWGIREKGQDGEGFSSRCTARVGIENPDIGSSDTGSRQLWIDRGVLPAMSSRNEGAIPISACKNNVARLVADQESLLDMGVLVFQ